MPGAVPNVVTVVGEVVPSAKEGLQSDKVVDDRKAIVRDNRVMAVGERTYKRKGPPVLVCTNCEREFPVVKGKYYRKYCCRACWRAHMGNGGHPRISRTGTR